MRNLFEQGMVIPYKAWRRPFGDAQFQSHYTGSMTAPPLPPIARALFLTGLCCALGWASPAVRAQDLQDDKGVTDIIQDLRNQPEAAWWNRDWRYRRLITIDDPQLLNAAGAIAFSDPDPLLLYNTGRIQDGGADLRVVMRDGTLLTCGVRNFGRDDGSGQIWCVPPEGDLRKRLEFYIYYGNANARPSGDAAPDTMTTGNDASQFTVGPEEFAAGATPPPAIAGQFFQDLVAIEPESLAPTGDSGPLTRRAATGASGEAVLQMSPPTGQASEARTKATIPSAGHWNLHVRYKEFNGAHRYAPFTVSFGGHDLVCGGARHADQNAADRDTAYAWASLDLDLPAGQTDVALRCTAPAAPDLILLTRDLHYKPDYRDVNGPVWMRFQTTDDTPAPFYVDLFCYTSTYTTVGEMGDTAAYLFNGHIAFPRKYDQVTPVGNVRLNQLPPYAAAWTNDPKMLLNARQWSPWGVTPAHGSFTWHSQVRFVGSGAPLSHLSVGYQFATRPDITRVFRSGTEETGGTNYIGIHMPPAVDLSALRNATLTYSDWGAQRNAMARELGFQPNQGPKSIVFATMAGAYSQTETDEFLKSMNLLGLNALKLYLPGGLDDYAKTMDAGGVPGVWEFSRSDYLFFKKYFYTVDTAAPAKDIVGTNQIVYKMLPAPPAGMTAEQFVRRTFLEKVDADYKQRAIDMRRSDPWSFDHMRYNDLDDEIGPVISGSTINEHPIFHAYWTEYLEEQGLSPAFFGAAKWDDVKAVDYENAPSQRARNIAQIQHDNDAATTRLENQTLDPDIPLDDLPDNKIDTPKPAAATAPAEPPATAPVDPTALRLEKRAYLWTQRFRSMLTALYYQAHTKAVAKYFPPGVHTCPNMQAMPIQLGRMWTGSLDIFDFARLGACSSIQIEDWCGYPLNIRFGMALAHAAGRKLGLPNTLLCVGATPGDRIVTALMEGTRNFLLYLYGPTWNIGPPWAEDKATYRSIGTTLHEVGRIENDILASKPRHAEAALLVSNDSEINGHFFDYPIGAERIAAYSALQDAQIPVEIVGEQEIIEDDALKNYKVLYVTDPHVDLRAQRKIRDWVSRGGILWADYAGLARQEYDEPSTMLDEVFGLRSRGETKPYVHPMYGYADLPPGPAVHVSKGELLDADDITGIEVPNHKMVGLHAEPEYRVSTGKILGTFSDGKPAIVFNNYGQGHAFLCGFMAPLAYAGFQSQFHASTATVARDRLFTAPARLAGIAPFVRTTAFGLLTGVHDGPKQTVLFLVDETRAMKDDSLRVSLPRPAGSAFNANGQAVEFKMDGNDAVLPIDMAANSHEMIVFNLKDPT